MIAYRAEIAMQYGVEAPFIRPEELSGDYVQDFPVCEHAIKSLRKWLKVIEKCRIVNPGKI